MWVLMQKQEPKFGQQRLKPGAYSGSPMLADGKIYITNEDGLTSVVRC